MKKILVTLLILSILLPSLSYAGRADNDFWRGSEIEVYGERGRDEDGPNHRIGVRWKWRFVPKGKDRGGDSSNCDDYEDRIEELEDRVEDLEQEVY